MIVSQNGSKIQINALTADKKCAHFGSKAKRSWSKPKNQDLKKSHTNKLRNKWTMYAIIVKTLKKEISSLYATNAKLVLAM